MTSKQLSKLILSIQTPHVDELLLIGVQLVVCFSGMTLPVWDYIISYYGYMLLYETRGNMALVLNTT